MDQKAIDALINQGSVDDLNQKQDELIKHMGENPPDAGQRGGPPPPADAEPKGKVMGQLSRVTEESEEGTNVVMSFLENVLNTVSKQKGFIGDIKKMYDENPTAIDINEALAYVNDSMSVIEENIFSAMDAFQFQDIGRQKLMKVMYTLARLNEYLNELLGGEAEREKNFGKKIEEKTMVQDQDKQDVDAVINGFKAPEAPAPEAPPSPTVTAEPETPPDFSSVVDNADVDSIIAEFQKQGKKE